MITLIQFNEGTSEAALSGVAKGTFISVRCSAIGSPAPTLSWTFTDWTNTNTGQELETCSGCSDSSTCEQLGCTDK